MKKLTLLAAAMVLGCAGAARAAIGTVQARTDGTVVAPVALEERLLAVQEHVQRTDNPHAVTAQQIGALTSAPPQSVLSVNGQTGVVSVGTLYGTNQSIDGDGAVWRTVTRTNFAARTFGVDGIGYLSGERWAYSHLTNWISGDISVFTNVSGTLNGSAIVGMPVKVGDLYYEDYNGGWWNLAVGLPPVYAFSGTLAATELTLDNGNVDDILIVLDITPPATVSTATERVDALALQTQLDSIRAPTNAVAGWLLYDAGSNVWLRVSVSNLSFTVWEVSP